MGETSLISKKQIAHQPFSLPDISKQDTSNLGTVLEQIVHQLENKGFIFPFSGMEIISPVGLCE